jgi:type I restriction enzyme S subunit
MKKGWQTTTLADLVEVQNGYAFSSKDYSESGHFLMRIGNVQNGFISTADPKFIKLPADGSLQRFVLSEDDILVSLTGNVGRVGVIQESHLPAALNQRVARISIRKDSSATRELLLLFLCSDWFREELIGAGHGAAQQNVSTKDLVEIQIPVPPLAEQQRIVGLLDEAFEGLATAKANAEKNLQNARALFESHLQSVFTQREPGWVENKLKSITTKIGSGATPRGGGESYKDEGISLIRSLNVHDLGFKYAKLAFLDDSQADELSNVEVQPRDVLLNITGASVARCAIVPEDVLPARVNQHVSIIRPIADKLDANFLHYLLISKPYKDQLLKTGEEGGSTRQAITKAQIQEFTVEYPATLKQQRGIVAKLDSVLAETQRLARLYERKLAALEALKKSLLHQAFTGEL